MTKADLIADIIGKTGLEQEEVSRVVEAFMETVKESLLQGNRIELRGFGTFHIKERASKVARNITKKEALVIPARQVPAFKPSRKWLVLFPGHED